MLKIRLQGTAKDIKWFLKMMQRAYAILASRKIYFSITLHRLRRWSVMSEHKITLKQNKKCAILR